MTTEDALLQTIIAQPQEDTPRLVYADWLDENDQEQRAEFIRVQIELSRIPKCEQLHCWSGNGSCSGQCDLRRREQALWPSSPVTFEEWFGFWQAGAALTRGFVSSLHCDWQNWVANAEKITRLQPLEQVGLTTEPQYRVDNERTDEFYQPELRHTRLRRSWDVWTGTTSDVWLGRELDRRERLAREVVISDRERYFDTNYYAYCRSNFEQQVQRDKTLDGFLRLKWKGIRFEHLWQEAEIDPSMIELIVNNGLSVLQAIRAIREWRQNRTAETPV